MMPKSHRGFSLIEMMIAITILAILVVLGVPNYRKWILNTHIRTASESIQNGLRLARNEAVQREANVRFQLTDSNGGADWIVCVVPDPASTSCAVSGAVTVQKFVSAGGAIGVVVGAATATPSGGFATTVSGGLPAGITFNALGRPVGYGTTSAVRIDATAPDSGARRLVTTISAGGLVRMCDPQLAQSTSPQGCS